MNDRVGAAPGDAVRGTDVGRTTGGYRLGSTRFVRIESVGT